MSKSKLRSERTVLAAIIAFFVLVAVGGWFVLIAPQRTQATQLGVKVTSVQSKIDLRRAEVASARQSKEIHTADLFRLTKAMPDQVDMPDILLELSQIAHDTGIQFQSITPSPALPVNGYQVVPIAVLFQGNFFDLADFVYRLRNLVDVHDGRLTATGRLFSIDSIDFSEGQDKFPQILATLNIDAYVYGVPETATTAIPAAPAGAGTTGTTTTPTTTGSSTTPATPAVPPSTADATGVTG